LQSAGTSISQTKEFGEAVQSSAQSADWQRLVAQLQALGFSATDSSYVAVAVAATRDMTPPSCYFIPNQPTSELRDEFVDVVTVILLFNVVNRIADAYGLQPEWARVRRTERLRRWTRWLMSVGLPYQMPLASDGHRDSESLTPHVIECLTLLQVESVSPIWRLLRHVPTIEIAIYQLLSASIHFYDGGTSLGELSIDGAPEQKRAALVAEATARLSSGLAATPPHVVADEVKSLRHAGILETRIVDLVLRAALTTAIRVINCDFLADMALTLDDRSG
jgi:hypothetical protein